MAVPTKEQCKLNLSFDMVAKTMTVSVQSIISTDGVDGLTYTITGGTLVDPLGNSVVIDDIGYDGNGGVGTQTYNAPLDSNGFVVNGSYNVLLASVLVDDGTPTTYTNVDSNYTLSYTAPVVTINQTVNCITPSFVSTDTTDYRVIDPTSQGYITPVTVDYAHNLYYPATSNGFPGNATLTSNLTITRGASEFYQGTQTGTVSHDVEYTFVDGLVVTDTLTGSLETLVDCATLLCTLTCGLNKLYNLMEANKTLNNTQYLLNKANFELLSSKAMLAQMNIDCGNSTMATTIIADIKAGLGHCCDDCGAADGASISGVGN